MDTAKINVKHKRTGKVIEINENQFGILHIMSNYDKVDIPVSEKDDGDGKPDMNWTKSDIQKWLDAKGITYGKSNNITKSDLIALV